MEVQIVPEEIKLQVPLKLAQFIDKLTEEGYFNSREDFARSSIEILAELYGLSKTSKGGKALLDVLADNQPTKASSMKQVEEVKKPISQQEAPKEAAKPLPTKKVGEPLTPEDYDVIDLFAGLKFEFEDALHAKYTMELMKRAKAPLPKAEFIIILEKLQANGNLEKSEHNGKVVWKLLEGY